MFHKVPISVNIAEQEVIRDVIIEGGVHSRQRQIAGVNRGTRLSADREFIPGERDGLVELGVYVTCPLQQSTEVLGGSLPKSV